MFVICNLLKNSQRCSMNSFSKEKEILTDERISLCIHAKVSSKKRLVICFTFAHTTSRCVRLVRSCLAVAPL